MTNDTDIQLSGPFKITDASGNAHDVAGIRIFDEGYGIIDVYVDFVRGIGELHLFEDAAVIRQVLARLRGLGYQGPDFGHGDLGLQDDKVIVLEAPEEFDDDDDDAGGGAADSASKKQLDALLSKFKA